MYAPSIPVCTRHIDTTSRYAKNPAKILAIIDALNNHTPLPLGRDLRRAFLKERRNRQTLLPGKAPINPIMVASILDTASKTLKSKRHADHNR